MNSTNAYDFVFNVIASLIAACLFAAAIQIFSTKWKRAAVTTVGVLQGTDLRMVFESPEEAKGSIQRAFKRSQNVSVLVGRGKEIHSDYYDSLIERAAFIDSRVLFPETEVAPRSFDWVAAREVEMGYSGSGQLSKEIQTFYESFRSRSKIGGITFRRYDAPYIGWIFVTDQSLFFAPATARQFKDTKVFEFGHGQVFDMFDRYFNLLWEDSRDSD